MDGVGGADAVSACADMVGAHREAVARVAWACEYPETARCRFGLWRPARPRRSTSSWTARDAGAEKHPGRVRVTHRFHALSGLWFEVVKRGRTWQSDRVYFFDYAGELASLPAEWTSVAAEDPFVVVSAGRSAFRTADLLELAGLIAGLRRNADSGPEDVKRITP